MGNKYLAQPGKNSVTTTAVVLITADVFGNRKLRRLRIGEKLG